jgi:hypothetical protein
VRILIFVWPRMYREVIAHAVREHRPSADEVLTADPGHLDSETRGLAPALVEGEYACRTDDCFRSAVGADVHGRVVRR